MDDNPYESPARVEERRGSALSIAAWIVFGLGLALTMRIAWIGATWPNKSEEEWNRVYVLGAFGVVLLSIATVLHFMAKRTSRTVT
jgi:fatty acid desaturase